MGLGAPVSAIGYVRDVTFRHKAARDIASGSLMLAEVAPTKACSFAREEPE